MRLAVHIITGLCRSCSHATAGAQDASHSGPPLQDSAEFLIGYSWGTGFQSLWPITTGLCRLQLGHRTIVTLANHNRALQEFLTGYSWGTGLLSLAHHYRTLQEFLTGYSMGTGLQSLWPITIRNLQQFLTGYSWGTGLQSFWPITTGLCRISLQATAGAQDSRHSGQSPQDSAGVSYWLHLW